jgi:hypothetical protein
MIKQIILLVIGGFVTYVFQLAYDNYQTEIKTIDYKTTIDKNFISAPNIPKHKIKIFIDNKEQQSITKIQIEIFNFSKKDFEEVPLYISLKPKNKEKLIVIGNYEEGFENIPFSVNKITDKNLLPQTSNTYGYLINILKRTEKYEPAVKFVFLLKGKVEPNIKVFTSMKNLKAIPFDYTHSPKSTTQSIYIIILLLAMIIGIILLMLFIVSPLISRFTYPLDKKPRIKFANELTDELLSIKQFQKCNFTRENLYDIIALALYKQRKKKWNKKNKISKWIEGFVEPKKDDYQN